MAQTSRTIRVNLGGLGASVAADQDIFAPYAALNASTLFKMQASAPVSDSLDAWRLEILDGSQVVTESLGAGPPPPALSWDGRDALGQMPGIDTTCAVVTETDPLYKGDVTAEVAGPDPAFYLNLESGSPWHTTFTGGQEGAYTATVRARDRAGNVATGQEKGFMLDSTPPGLGLALAALPPYAYADGNTAYYGQGSGVFTLTAVATDTLSGLFSLAFPETTAGGATLRLRSGQARVAA